MSQKYDLGRIDSELETASAREQKNPKARVDNLSPIKRKTKKSHALSPGESYEK